MSGLLLQHVIHPHFRRLHTSNPIKMPIIGGTNLPHRAVVEVSERRGEDKDEEQKPPGTSTLKRRMAEELGIAHVEEEQRALCPEELRARISELRERFPQEQHPLFLLFTGSKGEQGRSWCPDCTRAAPVVFSALEEFSPESVLLILNCERAEYKQSSFTYRENPDIALTSVPTLIR